MTPREMPPIGALTLRVRREYEEMPGLLLTMQQACRLWGLSPDLCGDLLNRLVQEGFLARTNAGTFVRV